MKISKWTQGVNVYAEELREFLKENNLPATYENLLNGASDWSQYSWGGSSLIYDYDIAKRLATPSEIKKCTRKDGSFRQNANAREQWLDVQARALYQASRKVLSDK